MDAAICCEPSVLPLSATMTSPSIPWLAIACCALRMHVASVSASLRHGMTTETSSSGGSATPPNFDAGSSWPRNETSAALGRFTSRFRGRGGRPAPDDPCPCRGDDDNQSGGAKDPEQRKIGN